LHTGVVHVPQAVRAAVRAADLAVADDVLLVAVEVEVPADLAVGDEAAAGVVVGCAVVVEDDAAIDDVPPERVSLRCRPALLGVGAAI
jgi:hypothetical protein